MRDLQAAAAVDVEADDLAFQQTQTAVRSALVADVEEHLQAETDAEERLAALAVFNNRLFEVGLAQAPQGVADGPDARQHEPVGGADLLGRGDDLRRVADSGERLLDAAKVGKAVVDDRQHRAAV